MNMRRFFVAMVAPVLFTLHSQPVEAGPSPNAGAISSAIAEPDCAPWDGPAFGLWIPAQELGGAANSWIYLRIWQRPEDSRGVFTFPQHGPRQKGAVVYFLELESPKALDWSQQPRQALTGNVSLRRVSRQDDVQGELDFMSDLHVRLRGSFTARWLVGHHRVCG